MNKTFKVIFNKARGTLMVANELTQSVQKKNSRVVKLTAVSLLLTFAVTGVNAESLNLTNQTQKFDKDVVYESTESTAIGLINSNLTINANTTATTTYKGKNYDDTGAGIKASQGSTANLNGNVFVTANGPYMNGLWADGKSSHIEVNGDKLIININSDRQDGAPQTAGIYAKTNTTESLSANEHASVIINSEQTEIYVNVENNDGVDYPVSAINATSQGIVKINGNLKAKARYLISTRGDSQVAINEDNEDRVIQLEGTIQYASPVDGSVPTLNSNLVINLKGSESYWTGTIMSYNTDSDALSLGLSDNAQWNVVADLPDPDANYVKVDNVTLDGGIINAEKAGQEVLVENLTLGEKGGTFNSVAERNADGSFNTSVLRIDRVVTGADQAVMTVNYEGITADDLTSQNVDSLDGLDVVEETDVLSFTENVQEGDIRGAWTRSTDANGVSTTSFAENTKLASFRGLNATALVAWRDEVAYTNQRMEFLRDNSHAYGAWAQVYGDESKYEDKAELTTTTVQVGADMTIGDWVAGAAFSYMTGEADLLRGDADTDAYTLSLYAERNFDSGLFVNGLARYGRLSTDATAGNMDASYDNNAFSLGGNVGYRFTFAEQAFVEPNFGLQYAYVMGDDYKASNGVKVEQDDFDALIASLGARIGFNFPNNAGKLFARASVNHDFLGEIDGTAGNGKAVQDMYVDLGGTWVTYGVGTQFNITDNLSVWGNVDRTTGGEVSTNYMMNAGLRYVF